MSFGCNNFGDNNMTENNVNNSTTPKKYKLNLELYNCVLYNGKNPYQLDYVIEGEKYYFILYPNKGFIIRNSPTWRMGNDDGNFWITNKHNIAHIKGGEPIVITNDLTIQANATLSGSLKYGFVNVYNPTSEEVEKLSKRLWFKGGGFLRSRSGGDNFEDLKQYIISFRKLYIDIPQITKELVFFGKHNTNISSNIITTNFIETDCGNVVIDEYNKNSLDYTSVNIELYLPFIGSISLDPNDVYNKELNIKYRVNPLNGGCLALVYSDGRQIAYTQGNVSFDIPLYYEHSALSNSGVNDNLLYMGELQPYIELRTNRQYQNMNQKLLNNNLWCKLSDINGYAVLNDIELKPVNKINKDEYEEIIAILQSGVIF